MQRLTAHNSSVFLSLYCFRLTPISPSNSIHIFQDSDAPDLVIDEGRESYAPPPNQIDGLGK